MKALGRGLLVTELIGFGVNSVTGDYSRGAAGFWVEDGEIQFPVEEVTIAGNLKEMFQSIVAIGCDVDTKRKYSLRIHLGRGSHRRWTIACGNESSVGEEIYFSAER